MKSDRKTKGFRYRIFVLLNKTTESRGKSTKTSGVSSFLLLDFAISMKSSRIFNLGILLALVLGVALGVTTSVPLVHTFAHTISSLFLNVFKLISLPMILLAIISTLTQMESWKETHLLLKNTLKYTITTTIIAATIALILFIIVHPVKPEEIIPSTFTPAREGYLSFLIKIIPPNLVQPFLENNVLGMTFIATVLGVTIVQLPEEKVCILRDLFKALFDVLLKITSTLIFIMPLGVFSFAVVFVENIKMGREQLLPLLLYAICVIGANLIQGFITLPLMLKFRGHSPKRIAQGMFPALTMAFFSKSSSATLPLTLSCAKNRVGISERTANFALPACSIINMNGCAQFILTTTLFVCASYGFAFPLWKAILWIFISTIAAIGNAGVPMGCFFLTTALLMALGMPLELMGMILPIYSLFDMVETALNVWSDSCVALLADRKIRSLSTNHTDDKKGK